MGFSLSEKRFIRRIKHPLLARLEEHRHLERNKKKRRRQKRRAMATRNGW